MFTTILCTWIAYTTAYGGCIVFFEAIMKLLQGILLVSSESSQRIVNISIGTFESRTNYLYFICFLCGLVPLVGLMIPPKFCYLVGKAFFSCWNIFHIAFGFTFNPPVNVIRTEIQNHIDQQYGNRNIGESHISAFTDVNRNLLIAQVCVNFVFILTFCIYTFFAAWDLLTRKAVYVILYCTIGVHLLSFPMLLALTYKNSSKKVVPGNVNTSSGLKSHPSNPSHHSSGDEERNIKSAVMLCDAADL